MRMWKQLISFFFFVVALTLIAAVNNLTAQSEQGKPQYIEVYTKAEMNQVLEKISGDIEFLVKKVVELDRTCLKKK